MVTTESSGRQRQVAVALVRASSDRQDHSVADQEAEARAWCAEVGRDLLHVFGDDGVPGSKLERPGLRQLLDYVQGTDQPGVVVIWKRNRLVRPDDPRDGLAIERKIEQAGWKLHYIQGAQPSGNALVDTLMATVEHHEAGEYLRSLATDSLRGLHRRAARGGLVVGKAPYGYQREVTWPGGAVQYLARPERQSTREAQTVRLVPGDPAEVEIVQWIFEQYSTAEFGLSTLAETLNTYEIPSPEGSQWRATVLRGILRNPAYRGDLAWNQRTTARYARVLEGKPVRRQVGQTPLYARNDEREWVLIEDHHPALVTRELWGLANEVLDRRGRERGGARRAASPYPLSGLIRCCVCGSRWVGASVTNNGKLRRRYSCSGYTHSRTCQPYTLSQPLLEEAVLTKLSGKLKPLAGDPRLREKIVEALKRMGVGVPDSSLGRLERERDQLRVRRARALENLTVVTTALAKELSAKITDVDARLAELEAEIAEARKTAQPLGESVEVLADRGVAMLDDFTKVALESPPEDRRRVFQAALDRVELEFMTEEPGPGRTNRRHSYKRGYLVLSSALGQVCMAGSPRARSTRTWAAARTCGAWAATATWRCAPSAT
ncbi:MAG: recombinase family protein [Planctomycetota bacterium]